MSRTLGPATRPYALGVWKPYFRMLYLYILPGRRTLTLGRLNGRLHVSIMRRTSGW